MSRKRYISTDISVSGKIEELTRRAGEYAVILWTWMTPHLDDWGRMEGEPDVVFFTVTPRFALLGRKPEDAEKALHAMHELGLITWYKVNGKRYIQVNTDEWFDLQYGGRLPPSEWRRIRQAVFERDNYTCQYCGKCGGDLECDHIVPVSRGGTNDISNLVTACKECNRKKAAKTAEEWLRSE